MKIGIITFHRAINYGAFLQAFSLKSYIVSLNYDVSMIDYWPKGHDDVYKLFNKNCWNHLSFIGKIKYFIVYILSYSRKRKRLKKMQHLQQKYLSLNKVPLFSTHNDLSEVDVDCIVYGSDQIWWKSVIPNYLGFDSVLWGMHIKSNIKKISYAASMGVINLNNDDKKNISLYLKNFDAISVRESDLREELELLTDKKISITIDPVFLTSKEDWIKYCKPTKHISNKKYVLLYNLLQSKDALNVANKIAKDRNCDVIEITGSVIPLKFKQNCIQTADAFEFLSLIKNADFVVTSSFHGVAFSVIFQRQFYALGFKNNSGRASSLLNAINLNNRLISDIRDVKEDIIDYSYINPKLEAYILSSKLFLNQNLI